MVSFAQNDSRTHTDVFSLQALNDSLSNANGPTTVEINLRAGAGKTMKPKRKYARSKSKNGKSNSNPTSCGDQAKQAINLVAYQHSSVEDNIRTQLMMTSLNEEILDQWSNEQDKAKLAEAILTKWNMLKDKHLLLVNEQKEVKAEIKALLAENDSMRSKFTNLLDSFQKFILTNEQTQKSLV